MSDAMTQGEITGGAGVLVNLFKFFIIPILVFSTLICETHIFAFAVTNLFVDKYNFEIVTLEPNYLANGYNNLLYFFAGLVGKIPFWGNLFIIVTVPSIIYASYYHSKNKRFPGVIRGTIKNNILFYFGLSFVVKLVFTISHISALILCFFPFLYVIYLLIFKNKIIPKAKKFNDIIKKSEKESDDSFVFKTDNGFISLDNPYRGIYIQGGAGSGKSASVFLPIIQQLGAKNFTGILYDFKSPELIDKVYLSYENSNIKVKSIDFKRPFLSSRVNPIHPMYLTKAAIANEYSQVIINNLLPESIKKMDFWIGSAKNILSGVMWWLRQKHPHICTLPHVITFIINTPIDILVKEISKDYEAGGMVASLRESIDRGSERTVAGMLATLQNALSILNSPDIFWILSSNDVDLHLNNPENPQFLCIGNDSTLPTVYTPAISLIIAVALKQMNQPNQQKSAVLLDEAPTIFIPNIEQIPATARSNKIATVFGVQDYAQLVDKYGEGKAQVIISNLGNQFFGRTTNYKTAEMVQNLFSKKDELFVSKNEGAGTSGRFVHLDNNSSAGTSENIQERHRVKINEIVNLSQGEFYGIIAEGSPREFLKTQFNQSTIRGEYINPKIPVNEAIMKENYFKIIKECKDIIG